MLMELSNSQSPYGLKHFDKPDEYEEDEFLGEYEEKSCPGNCCDRDCECDDCERCSVKTVTGSDNSGDDDEDESYYRAAAG